MQIVFLGFEKYLKNNLRSLLFLPWINKLLFFFFFSIHFLLILFPWLVNHVNSFLDKPWTWPFVHNAHHVQLNVPVNGFPRQIYFKIVVFGRHLHILHINVSRNPKIQCSERRSTYFVPLKKKCFWIPEVVVLWKSIFEHYFDILRCSSFLKSCLQILGVFFSPNVINCVDFTDIFFGAFINNILYFWNLSQLFFSLSLLIPINSSFNGHLQQKLMKIN